MYRCPFYSFLVVCHAWAEFSNNAGIDMDRFCSCISACYLKGSHYSVVHLYLRICTVFNVFTALFNENYFTQWHTLGEK